MAKGKKSLHLLDKFVGVPLIFILGLLRRKNKSIPKKLNRVAFMKSAAIGDTVLIAAVIRDFSDNYPISEITFFAGDSNYEIAKHLPEVNKVVLVPVTNPVTARTIIRQQGSFDLFIDFGQWPRMDALLSHFVKAKFKLGFRNEGQFRHYVFDRTVVHKQDVHEIENFRNLIKPVLTLEPKRLPSLMVSSTFEKDQLVKSWGNFVIFHLWSGGINSSLKEWDKNNWIELAESLIKDNYTIVFTGAPKDRERTEAVINKISGDINKIKNAAGLYSLKDTIHMLSLADAVVSIDTGIMHIASALNIPLVAIHGPTRSDRWGSLSSNTISINSLHKHAGFIKLGFEKSPTIENLTDLISVHQVSDALTKVLKFNKLGPKLED